MEWFGLLQDVDADGVPPALRASPTGAAAPRAMVEGGPATLRPDYVSRPEAAADLLQQAAQHEGPFVRVPKIVTAADAS